VIVPNGQPRDVSLRGRHGKILAVIWLQSLASFQIPPQLDSTSHAIWRVHCPLTELSDASCRRTVLHARRSTMAVDRYGCRRTVGVGVMVGVSVASV